MLCEVRKPRLVHPSDPSIRINLPSVQSFLTSGSELAPPNSIIIEATVFSGIVALPTPDFIEDLKVTKSVNQHGHDLTYEVIPGVGHVV